MSGAPSLDLTRTVNTVVSGSVTVAETEPTPLSATADPPEAVGSTTSRPTPETVSFSATTVTVVGVVATTAARAADNLRLSAARSLWRQTAPASKAAAASAGTVGATPDWGANSDANTLPSAKDTDALATGGEVTVTDDSTGCCTSSRGSGTGATSDPNPTTGILSTCACALGGGCGDLADVNVDPDAAPIPAGFFA